MSANSSACSTHPGWKLSRECIRDTLIAKRTGVFMQGGLAAQLCSANLRLLRETQLSQYKETKLLANRYWLLKIIKRYRPGSCKCCWEDFDPVEYMQRADNQLVHELSHNDIFLCGSCLRAVLAKAKTATTDSIIVYIEGGIVQWLAIPGRHVDTYEVADTDVFDGGDIEDCRDCCVRILTAQKSCMNIVY